MKIQAILGLLFVAILSAAKADLTIVSDIQSKDLAAAPAGNMTMKLSNGKVRVDTGPAHIIVLPLEKKMLVLVDAQKICMVKSLNNLTAPEGSGEKPTIERTGKKETINGYDCEQILLKDKKGRITEIWSSPSAPDMSEFASTFKSIAQLNPKKSEFEWSGMMSEKGLNTYPIRAIRYGENGKEESRVTVLSINKDSIPASLFVKPDGYMEMQMPDFGGLGGTDIAPTGPSSSNAPNSMQQLQDMQKRMQTHTLTPEEKQKLLQMGQQLQQQMQSK